MQTSSILGQQPSSPKSRRNFWISLCL